MARCLSNGNAVTLAEGRERGFPKTLRQGFLVIQCKIVAAMVAHGAAEFVDPGAEGSSDGL